MAKTSAKQLLINLGEVVGWLMQRQQTRMHRELWLKIYFGQIPAYEAAQGGEAIERHQAARLFLDAPEKLWADSGMTLEVAEQGRLMTNQSALSRHHRDPITPDHQGFYAFINSLAFSGSLKPVEQAPAQPVRRARPVLPSMGAPIPKGFPPVREN